jgi:hypothetical protein
MLREKGWREKREVKAGEERGTLLAREALS